MKRPGAIAATIRSTAHPVVHFRVRPVRRGRPQLRTHEGYEWLYVLAGELRLLLAGHDITMKPGEVAEFDTQVPHRFGPAGDRPVEILSILSREGERIHVRARPRRKTAGG